MIETAKKHAKAPVPGAAVEEEAAPATGDEEGDTAEAAEVPSAGEAEAKDAKAKEAEEAEESDDPAVVEMRRERAQRILKALGAR